jgi:hypothetical protein
MNLQTLSAPALRKRRRRLVSNLPPIEQVLRGTLVESYKRCGRPNCHCVDGPGHGPKRYLGFAEGSGDSQETYSCFPSSNAAPCEGLPVFFRGDSAGAEVKL